MNTFSVCMLFLALFSPLVVANHMPNFIAQDDLVDGQHEIRIHYNGVTAKQTSVDKDHGSVSGLVLRQVHARGRLLTLVYVGQASEQLEEDALSLRDCRLTEDLQEIEEFLDDFKDDVDTALDTPAGSWLGPLRNVTFVHLSDESKLPRYLRPALHLRRLRAQCKAHLRSVRKAARAQRREDRTRQDSQHSRKKRWIFNEFFILPGTKWCGNEDLASSFRDLDGHVGADRCCRKHDLCPLNIGGMQKKFGTYNSHPTTISFCLCDERFKACLKLTKTGVADFVGDVFFNKMKTKCFDLVKRRVCTKREGWLGIGPCVRYSVRQMAVLRNNVGYEY